VSTKLQSIYSKRKNEFQVDDSDDDTCGGGAACLFCMEWFSRDKHEKERAQCMRGYVWVSKRLLLNNMCSENIKLYVIMRNC
jgi:hypothetical protein